MYDNMPLPGITRPWNWACLPETMGKGGAFVYYSALGHFTKTLLFEAGLSPLAHPQAEL